MKQSMPQRFVPYLEKHRIYDLFFELGTLLGINKPKDHILFLRNILIHMSDMRDKPKLFIIAPPYFDKKKFVDTIAEKSGQAVISRKDFLEDGLDFSASEIASKLFVYMVENEILKKGWILYDYPKNLDEAKAMLHQGIIPSHTFVIVPSTRTSAPSELWIKGLEDMSQGELKAIWEDYQSTSLDLRIAFKATLQEINIQSKSFMKITEECYDELQEFAYRGPLLIQRIVLIGPRGSRRGVIAKQISDHLNIVLVDMVELIEQARIRENEIGDQIRFLDKKKVPIYASILIKILQDRLLAEDCMRQGWILIRFPRDRADLEVLYSFDTPPNRVIFLGVNTKDCFNYLKEKRINKYHGNTDTITNIKRRNNFAEENDYFIHPTDDEKRVFLEHESYTSALQGMLDYCGKNCTIVNAEGTDLEIAERIEGILSKTLPIYKSKEESIPVTKERPVKCIKESTESIPSSLDVQIDKETNICSKTYLAKEILKKSKPKENDCSMIYHYENVKN